MKRVLVGLSGGVDSAVSAALLMQEGHEVEAAFMHNWHTDPYAHCESSQDYESACCVADHLGIPLHSIDFASEYFSEVFEPFLDALAQNLTPNPDVLCNKQVKFNHFLTYAQKAGFDYIATGHYADIHPETFELYQPVDQRKDQTYFLHQLTRAQLKHTQFPLAHLDKKQVKKLAYDLCLPNHSRAESMGICFIGANHFSSFIRQYLLDQPGDIVTLKGEVVGQHQGLHHYTIGQRKGLGIGGLAFKKTDAWYVVEKKALSNELIVVQSSTHHALYDDTIYCKDPHWIGDPPEMPLKCYARVRHGQPLTPCTLVKTDESFNVYFESPQRAIAPGQYIVFYQSKCCLGGSMILGGIKNQQQ